MPFQGRQKDKKISQKSQKTWVKKTRLQKIRQAFATVISPRASALFGGSPPVTSQAQTTQGGNTGPAISAGAAEEYGTVVPVAQREVVVPAAEAQSRADETRKAIMSSTPDQNTASSETSQESLEEKNVLKRVSSLPLVTSVCDLVSANYTSIKKKSSYLQSVCNGAEKSVKSLTGVAVSRVQPILTTFEPQIAAANKYACKSLDAMEEKLPILQQTADQVVSGTKELVSSTVTDVKNAVTYRLSGVVDRTKDAVHGGVKTTTSLVTSSMSLVIGTKMGQMAKNSVDTVLGRSHAFVDHYLLVMDDDVGELQTSCDSRELSPMQQKPIQVAHEGYLACLISLLKKFHCYISQQSQCHIRNASQSLQRVLENQYLEWKAWMVALYYTVTLPLRTVYLIILFTMEELSSKIQEHMPDTSYFLEDLQMALTTLECLQDLCRRIFTRVWRKILEEENLNALLDYIRNIIPFCFLANHCKCRT